LGLSPKDLVPLLGGKGKVSEILNRRRTLSLGMIRRLSEGLSIPVQSLIGEYDPLPAGCVAESTADYRVNKRRKAK
jgi:hypothetical protein